MALVEHTVWKKGNGFTFIPPPVLTQRSNLLARHSRLKRQRGGQSAEEPGTSDAGPHAEASGFRNGASCGEKLVTGLLGPGQSCSGQVRPPGTEPAVPDSELRRKGSRRGNRQPGLSARKPSDAPRRVCRHRGATGSAQTHFALRLPGARRGRAASSGLLGFVSLASLIPSGQPEGAWEARQCLRRGRR